MSGRSTTVQRRQPLGLTAMLFVLLLLLTACGPRFDRESITIAGGNTGGAPVDSGGGGFVDAGTGQVDQGTVDGGSVDGGSVDGGTVDGGADGGTTDPGAGDPGSTDGSTTGTSTTGSGSTGSGSSTGSTGSGSTGSGSTGSTGSTGSGSGSGTGGTTTPPPANSDPGPAPGVTDETIRIGYLLPLTGAAPVPAGFDAGVKVYWNWLSEQGGINGRDVEVIIYNTDSKTSTAVAEARKAVQQDKVFTLLSLDRLEVQEAIANFLEQVGMPHVMVQSPAAPPSSWKNTFIASVDHIIQGRGIATFFSEDLGAAGGAKKVAFVREQTTALKPGTDAFEQRAAELGLDVVAKLTTDPGNNDQSGVVNALIESDADIVWLYMAPTVAANIVNSAGTRTFVPIWFANNISWQFEQMNDVTASFLNGSYAFSSWVPLNDTRADKYRSEFRRQITSEDPTKEPDDIGLVGWGAGEVISDVLASAGQDLGWNNLRTALKNFKKAGNVWTSLDFTGGFNGANVVKVFKSNGTDWSLVQDNRVLR